MDSIDERIKASSEDRTRSLLRPLLGLLQGVLIYLFIKHGHFSAPGTLCAIIIFTLPLFALQIKLPSKDSWLLSALCLPLMGLVYGFVAYYLMNRMQMTPDYIIPLLAEQCLVSAFIVLVFYCVVIEEKAFRFPYATLFSEAWQILLKIILGQILVLLTWGLCILADQLFQLLNISFVHEIVWSEKFPLIMPPFFFGIAMSILYRYEDILTKLRNIFLAFCRFLYPILVVISLSFLIVLPFSQKTFSDFWPVIIGLSGLSITLFNGVFQAGSTSSTYPRWFTYLIYASFIVLCLYSIYILKFPLQEMHNYGFKAEVFLLFLFLLILATYNLCYSLAIFFSKTSWLNMIKTSNKTLALVTALIYLLLALPWFDVTKLAAHLQLTRLLHNQPISNPYKRFSAPGYLVGANLQNVDLSGRDLKHINFTKANLQGANLAKTNLSGSNFIQADLSHANLVGANLENANLKEANLSKANLSKANLRLAQLSKANLCQTNLNAANLATAWMNQTNLDQTNLSKANLENVNGLQQSDLDKACGSETKLPASLSLKPCAR